LKCIFFHLSDIHFRESSNFISTRVEMLARALWSNAAGTARQYLVLTGDIAAFGKAGEYEAASAFLTLLIEAGRQHISSPSLQLLVIPGNHDCNFSGDTEIRTALLSAPINELTKKNSQSSVICELGTVQEDFFSFLESLKGAITPLACSGTRTLWIFDDQVEDRTIRFICLNSALASTIHERQGELFLLDTDLSSIQALEARDLTVLMLHHPLNWFEATNSVHASSTIDSVADLVFSGHQHIESSFYKERLEGNLSTFFEATALQSPSGESGFRVVTIDFDEVSLLEVPFTWRDGGYFPRLSSDPTPRPLRRNPAPRRTAFVFSNDHEKFLNDLGVGFTHPRREVLALADLYVPPDLTYRHLRLEAGRFFDSHRIQSEASLEDLASRQRCLVIGEERAGKTALAKTLLRLLHVRGVVPVLVPGDLIKPKELKDVQRFLAQFIDAQYGKGAQSRFWQLERSQRCFVIDDFHRSHLNSPGQTTAIAAFREHFDLLFIFGDSLFRFEELRQDDGSLVPFADFDHFEIREFGYLLRARLIERWHSLGRERVLSDADLVHETDRSERLVEGLLGKNLLPSFPFAILTILQLAEAGREASRDAGSFGSMYEALIAAALTTGSSATDVNVNYAFLAALAHRMFLENRLFLSLQEVKSAASQYAEQFAVDLRLDARLRALAERRMLIQTGSSWEFRYPYIYYYFVARWFRDRVGKNPAAREQLLEMADRIFSERNTNILVFYLALTQDLGVVERVLRNAEEIYATSTACDFDKDVEFLNQLFKGQLEPLTLELPSRAAREAYREKLDGEAERDEAAEFINAEEDVRYKEELDEIVKLNIAFKTLHILGQFVRNFPGSLEAGLKKEIVEACYRLGLRTLGALLRQTRFNVDDMRSYFRELVKDRRSFLSDAEVYRAGDEAVLALTRACSFGVLKKVSNAVGLEELALTYAAVLDEQETVSTRLIDLSIKLDHFAAPPEAEIYELSKDVRRSHFTTVVLRDLVKQHLMIFPVAQQLRQRLLSWLDMRRPLPEVASNPSRKLR